MVYNVLWLNMLPIKTWIEENEKRIEFVLFRAFLGKQYTTFTLLIFTIHIKSSTLTLVLLKKTAEQDCNASAVISIKCKTWMFSSTKYRLIDYR